MSDDPKGQRADKESPLRDAVREVIASSHGSGDGRVVVPVPAWTALRRAYEGDRTAKAVPEPTLSEERALEILREWYGDLDSAALSTMSGHDDSPTFLRVARELVALVGGTGEPGPGPKSLDHGRYRVVTGCDGARYLYFFPGDGSQPRNLVLDTDEESKTGLSVLIGGVKTPAEFEDFWSTKSFGLLINDLEQHGGKRPETAVPQPDDPQTEEERELIKLSIGERIRRIVALADRVAVLEGALRDASAWFGSGEGPEAEWPDGWEEGDRVRRRMRRALEGLPVDEKGDSQ